LHHRDEGSHAEEDAREVDIQDSAPLVQGFVVDLTGTECAGIVHEDRWRAELVLAEFNDLTPVFLLRYVESSVFAS
jgi:hypothetical protein